MAASSVVGCPRSAVSSSEVAFAGVALAMLEAIAPHMDYGSRPSEVFAYLAAGLAVVALGSCTENGDGASPAPR